jgi:ubiquinone/menaquinone biosynthesis C-methylase UbiE
MPDKTNYYDAISSSYEELHKEEQLKKIAIIKSEIYPKSEDIILDLGSGMGFLDFPNQKCTIVRLDPSKELLKLARGKKFLGVAEDMPFPDSYFDLVISITAMQNFDDIHKGIMEIKRVAKPNASIVLTFLKRSKKRSLICSAIEKNFSVVKIIDEEKDIIYILGNRK